MVKIASGNELLVGVISDKPVNAALDAWGKHEYFIEADDLKVGDINFFSLVKFNILSKDTKEGVDGCGGEAILLEIRCKFICGSDEQYLVWIFLHSSGLADTREGSFEENPIMLIKQLIEFELIEFIFDFKFIGFEWFDFKGVDMLLGEDTFMRSFSLLELEPSEDIFEFKVLFNNVSRVIH